MKNLGKNPQNGISVARHAVSVKHSLKKIHKISCDWNCGILPYQRVPYPLGSKIKYPSDIFMWLLRKRKLEKKDRFEDYPNTIQSFGVFSQEVLIYS